MNRTSAEERAAAQDLFDDLVRHVLGRPDKHGEVWIDCPNCGKGDRHFSFSLNGAHCFACGYSQGLRGLAEKVGLRDRQPYQPPAPRPAQVTQAPRPVWLGQADALAERFAAAPGVVARWQDYKPLPAAVIRAYGLGHGVFPGLWFKRGGWQRCDHPRLIVPLRAGGSVTGFRCRAIVCTDCPKWISPPGAKLPLFNGARLLGRLSGDRQRLLGDAPGIQPAQAGVLAIVENIADALLVEARWDYPAVATHGVTIWRDEWTAALAAASLETAVIAYDHDLPGNGPSSERERRAMQADWLRRHPRGAAPVPGGVRLANRLLAAGVPAARFPWPETAPLGYDVGAMLIQETRTYA